MPLPAMIVQGLRGPHAATRFALAWEVNLTESIMLPRGDELIEQWIYHLDNKKVRFVNLLRSPGELKPRVIADYTIPSSSLKGGTQTVR